MNRPVVRDGDSSSVISPVLMAFPVSSWVDQESGGLIGFCEVFNPHPARITASIHKLVKVVKVFMVRYNNKLKDSSLIVGKSFVSVKRDMSREALLFF